MTTADTTLRPPLRRSAEGRILGGVASGISRHLGVDPALVRIAFVVVPLGLLPYLIAWILLPSEGGPAGEKGGRDLPAVGLLALGAMLALDAAEPSWLAFDVDGRYVGPAILIAIGVGLLARSVRD